MNTLTAKTMSKEMATEAILLAKRDKGLTFEDLSAAINRHPVWTASAIMGQSQMSTEEADKLVEILELDPSISSSLQEFPMKGSLKETVPTDPLIYRFYEVLQVYGTTIKSMIHEKFGDGIMSAIDFTLDIEKKEDPKGDRVVVTLDGKFLPYKKW
ncbi:cyanase [Bacillus sp. Marseille-P3661]|uniref:cyanase n=1 Tax=Bacillus sp. Marseille-P3661 TaxID=1936234 RepID=UPI0021558076|nr:cyanase [Bacillus sp. Marseille-P3661]